MNMLSWDKLRYLNRGILILSAEGQYSSLIRKKRQNPVVILATLYVNYRELFQERVDSMGYFADF